jgi:uncharacterized protein (TIGR02599 family)
MEFLQPADYMTLYSETTNAPTYTQVSTSPSWQITALNNSPTGVRPLANNVVALLLLPATTTTDTSGSLAPGFLYNSETVPSPAAPATAPTNRLPPIIRVVMYTIDEKSAQHLPQSSTVPNLYVDTSGHPIFVDPTKLYPNTTTGDIGDLARFEATLTAMHLTFRRFEAAVQPPPQPWNTRN